MTRRDTVRILHVVGSMNPGGVETWLMNVLRHLDADRFSMDFLVHTARPGLFDDEIRQLGGQVLPCLSPSRPHRYAANLMRLNRRHGPDLVVHSYVHHFSGVVCRLARLMGVPLRIAHSHTDAGVEAGRGGAARRAYLAPARCHINRHATVRLAASREAGVALFGRRSPFEVLHCGIDLKPYRAAIDRRAARAELGIGETDFVVGHVGSLLPVKNHHFLLQVVAELAKLEPGARLLLIGDGPLREAIREQSATLGLARRLLMPGYRADVPRLMHGAMDVLVFPSHYEGLGLAVVEAQAAGLPALVSEAVPREAAVVPGLVRRLSLADSAAQWAKACLEAAHQSAPAAAEAPVDRVAGSSFNICRSVARLESIYGSAAG